MTLHGNPIERDASLPDGRSVRVRVGVARDPYVADRVLDTVDLELFEGDEPLAAVNTVLSAGDDSAAQALARDVVAGLESGGLEPTAAALEPIAERST